MDYFDGVAFPTTQIATYYPEHDGSGEIRKRKGRNYHSNPLVRIFGSVVCTYILVFFGMVVMMAIELDDRKNLVRESTLAFNTNWALIENSTLLTAKQKDDFIDYLGDEPIELSNDEYADQYMLLAFSIVTTIGYGNITPVTVESRWFCVFFALVGIPCAGILFTTAASSTLDIIQNWMLDKQIHKAFESIDLDHSGYLSKAELLLALKKLDFDVAEEDFDVAFAMADDGDGQINRDEFLVMLQKLSMGDKYLAQQHQQSICLVVVFFIHWALGGMIFRYYEGFRFEDALYFSMVTLTTVGLGDLFTTSRLGIIVNICYSSIGLGIIATCISLGSEYVALKARKRAER
jgi:hypothetical protein